MAVEIVSRDNLLPGFPTKFVRSPIDWSPLIPAHRPFIRSVRLDCGHADAFCERGMRQTPSDYQCFPEPTPLQIRVQARDGFVHFGCMAPIRFGNPTAMGSWCVPRTASSSAKERSRLSRRSTESRGISAYSAIYGPTGCDSLCSALCARDHQHNVWVI
jgi:hypothetical protein